MKKSFFGVILVLGLVFLTSFVSALSAEIGNPRAIITTEVGFWGTTIERTVLVKNNNDFPINVSLMTSDENSSSMIELIDEEFVLAPGASKDARFNIKVKKAGDYDLKVNVVFSPPEGKGAGAILTSILIVHAKDSGEGDTSDDGEDEDTESEEDILDDENEDDGGQSGINAGIVAVSVSTLILALILIALLIFMKKKDKKVNRKRAGRSA